MHWAPIGGLDTTATLIGAHGLVLRAVFEAMTKLVTLWCDDVTSWTGDTTPLCNPFCAFETTDGHVVDRLSCTVDVIMTCPLTFLTLDVVLLENDFKRATVDLQAS